MLFRFVHGIYIFKCEIIAAISEDVCMNLAISYYVSSNFSSKKYVVEGMCMNYTHVWIKHFVYAFNHRLAKIKADAKRKREEREHEEHLQQMEKKQRFDLLHRQYSEWNAGIYPDGRVELALVSVISLMMTTKRKSYHSEVPR